MINGEKMHAKYEVCGDMLAEFDQAGQKIRYTRGPSSDATPQLRRALEEASIGSSVPSTIAEKAFDQGSEWKSLLGQRCKGRDGTLITWPSGRAEMCPPGTQPVHGQDYLSWQCDGMYKKEKRLHCCSVKGRMRCVPNMVDQSGAMKCNCPGVGGGGWTEEEEEQKEEAFEQPDGTENAENGAAAANSAEKTNASIGIDPLAAVLLTSYGFPGHSREARRRGEARQLGQDFL
jgi:hypothetical protein